MAVIICQWEKAWDCLFKMRAWIIDNALADESYLVSIEEEIRGTILGYRNQAWKLYEEPIQIQKAQALKVIGEIARQTSKCNVGDALPQCQRLLLVISQCQRFGRWILQLRLDGPLYIFKNRTQSSEQRKGTHENRNK